MKTTLRTKIVLTILGIFLITATVHAQKQTQSQQAPIVSEDYVVELSDTKPAPVPITDLDPSLRNRLPDLSINALSYSSNQAKRFVMINQAIYKEGEDLGNGIVVEKIKRSTVILSFEGNQFTLRPL